MPWLERLRSWVPTRERLQASPALRWLMPWLGHPDLWHWSRRGVALGVALGVFFGLLIPLAQVPATAVAAVALRANLPAAAASTLVTNPVTFGPVYYAAYRLGLRLTGGPKPPPEEVLEARLPEADKTPEGRMARLGKPLIVGLSVIATTASLLAYFTIDLVWRWQAGRKRRTGK